MKYYESSFEEYIHSSKHNNVHNELEPIIDSFPPSLDKFQNLILYGPSGSGKYTQSLKIIEKYSPSKLKYERRLSVSNDKNDKKKQVVVDKVDKTDKGTTPSKSKPVPIKKEICVSKKQEFQYRISDIHYEVDMSLLGCNSKNLWHDIYFQIVDIVSVKQNKSGIILCKNFDSIYNELLSIFYSYIKHPLEHLNIHIYFILLTDNIGFIPNTILNSSQIISIRRPLKTDYFKIIENQTKPFFQHKLCEKNDCIEIIMNDIDEYTIMNTKELFLIRNIHSVDEIPNDIDYTICEKILEHIQNPQSIKITEFRNLIYDMLIYNVNISECIYYIISYCIQHKWLETENTSKVLQYTYTFFKYYNNNYRSIYHLESIIFFIINRIHFKVLL
jgi:hypothetical protein